MKWRYVRRIKNSIHQIYTKSLNCQQQVIGIEKKRVSEHFIAYKPWQGGINDMKLWKATWPDTERDDDKACNLIYWILFYSVLLTGIYNFT